MLTMYENQSDEELLGLVKNGNKKAFDIFFLRYYPTLRVYARQYVNPDDTHEVVQDVMLWLWEKRQDINISQSVRSYIFNAVRYKCLNVINNDSSKKTSLNVLHDEVKAVYESPDFYILEELSKKIEEAIENLPDSYKQAFVMNRFKNMTYKQIAEETGVSVKTVDYRMQQALKILRTKLKDYLHILPFFLFMD